MRHSRVLTVLALIGILGLTATLVTRGRAAAPNRARAAAASPLRGALQQQLQKLLPGTWPARPQVVVPSFTPPPAAKPCPVASGSCSGNPCVIFVQSGSQPVALATGGVAVPALSKHIATAPTASVPFGPQRCTRHALPQTERVNSQIASPALPAATPVVSARTPR